MSRSSIKRIASEVPGELALTIINEGADYQERLKVAHDSDFLSGSTAMRWLNRVNVEAEKLRRQFGRKFSETERLDAALELAHYYREHIAEIAAA